MTKIPQLPFVVFLLIALGGCSGLQQVDWKHELTASEVKAKEQWMGQPPVEKLTAEFINRLVQEVDDTYRVKHFSSKQQLVNYISEIASEDLAEKVVNFYYNEQKDGLYIVPTELMPWFVQGNDYELEQLEQRIYKLKQINESSLYGNYEITMRFIYKNKKWKIEGFHVKQHAAF